VGFFDMREFFGPGWRLYDFRCGEVLVLMLGGGDKSTSRPTSRPRNFWLNLPEVRPQHGGDGD